MSWEQVKVAREDAVGVITLDRPRVLNALSGELVAELGRALDELDADADVRCIAVVGSDRAFAAGADIGQMVEATPVDMLRADAFAAIERIGSLATPVVAGVSGYCLGGGCELAMACDFIVASETATFGQPEINLGIIPGAGGSQRLTRAIGKAKAMDLVLTGRSLSAIEAEAAGLVARLAAPEAWLEETMRACREVASRSALALRVARDVVNASQEMSLQAGLAYEQRSFHMLFASNDQREGMAAFRDKRTPEFVGS